MLGTLVRLLPPAARAMVRLHLARRSESAPVHPIRRSGTVLNQNLLMSLDGLLLAKPVPGHEIVRGVLVDQQEVHVVPAWRSNDGVSSPRNKCIKAVHGAAHLVSMTEYVPATLLLIFSRPRSEITCSTPIGA